MREFASRFATYGLGFTPSAAGIRRFFIVCAPRSGSELLVTLLNSHPAVRCEGELFQRPPPLPLRFAAGRAANAARRGAQAWGCKILDLQLRWFPERFGPPDEFFERAVHSGWTIVHLRRRDLLTQAVSGLHAERRQHHYRVGDGRCFEPIVVEPGELIAWLHNLEQNAEWLASAVRQYASVELEYERDLFDGARHRATVASVCAALGVPEANVHSDLRRVAPPAAAERVANWQEVSDALAHTRFRSLIDG